ncbi:MAG: hypothetical protein AAF539_00285 [Planctomycetota bacterium]
MRLTLRTLLAYLDNTLEPEDAVVLKAKLEASPRAVALVSRIRGSMNREQLSAPSPDAMGPLENANVMSEYLDSMLSVEQLAEIEQWCQESDVSLAEAAACHHILAIALGQPARVPDRLRERVYGLPNSDALRTMEAASSRTPDMSPQVRATDDPISYASLNLPAASNDDAMDLAAMETLAATDAKGIAPAQQASTSIGPVGPNDSGVADAATRLRDATGDDATSRDSVALAGATRRAMLESDGYRGGIRPSRITPWLVSLALVAVFLFALARVFQPMMRESSIDQVASQTTNPIDAPKLVSEKESGQADPAIAEELPDEDNTDDSSDSVTPDTDTEASELNSNPLVPDSPALAEIDLARAPVDDTSLTMTGASSTSDESKNATAEPIDVASDQNESTRPTEVVVSENPVNGLAATPPKPIDMPPVDLLAMDSNTRDDLAVVPAVEMASEDLSMKEGFDPLAEPIKADDAPSPSSMEVPGAPDASPDVVSGIVATLINPDSLVLTQSDASWQPLTAQQREISAGATILAPALYRPILVSRPNEEFDADIATASANADSPSAPADAAVPTRVGDLEWMLAGPTRIQLTRDDEGMIRTRVIDGRFTLASTRENVRTRLQLGQREIELTMPEAQTVLAIELTHIRLPGFDPLVQRNRQTVYRILAIQGGAELSPIGSQSSFEPVNIVADQQWRANDTQPPVVNAVDELPTWVDVPPRVDLLVQSAREGLLTFVRDGQAQPDSLERSLREAMAFRRVEVAALAAETLLMIGRGDVYFGNDGIFSRVRQRTYWTEHFETLRLEIARSADAAVSVRDAAMRAELADGAVLFQLLVGFSPQQLAAGGDENLVDWLDSPSMPVRVLAIENLRQITGETLGYRPDLENALRRAPDIRKWVSKLKRGDIRYANETR